MLKKIYIIKIKVDIMSKKKHIFYFDALRALAIICVILIHIFDVGTRDIVIKDYGMVPSLNWFICCIMINCFRIGVPIFLMLSGALSLGRDWTIKEFLSKRLPRIINPFIFWVVFSSIIVYIISIFTPLVTVDGLFSLIYMGFTGRPPYFFQNWFFWMILGTYLIMPIYNKWIKNSKLTELEYFLAIWLITCIFDFTLNMEFPVKISYFTSPIGLVVLGYYLRYTERKIFTNKIVPILLIILPCIAMVTLSYLFSSTELIYKFERYTIFVSLEAAGVFLLFRNANFDAKGCLEKVISKIAQYSYGIYLAHVAVLILCKRLIPNIFPYTLWTLILFLLVLLIPMTLLYLFSKVPVLKNNIGVK